MLLFLLVITVAQAKTVRYSNVPPRAAIATKTYDLDVPGSAPIRIIEAEPIWSPEIVTTPTVQHRRPKSSKEYFTTQSTQSTISEPVTSEPETSKPYSSESLNDFLKEYAQKIKEGRKKFDVNNDEPTTEEPINKLASIYLENDRMDDEDKLKSWGLVDMKRHKHPFDDKKGWVTLEAVPWSTSKISKWQSNHKPELKPWENPRPQNWNTKYSTNQYKNPFIETGENYNVNNDNDYNNGYEDENIFNDKPVATYDEYQSKPSFDRPQYVSKPSYANDVRPIKIKPDNSHSHSDWQPEMPSKPTWNMRPQTSDSWMDRNQNQPPVFMYGSQAHKDENRDIITDGRPGDFPKQQPISAYESIQERPMQASSNQNQNHPPSHPSNGNGEWVLVSTTKGYQYPRTKHQRSIEVTPDSIGTRRGIRLTVLPPDNDTNMTTSHGGLLEVESTFETVEESQHKHALAAASSETMNVNVHRPNKKVHKVKKPVRTQVVLAPKPSNRPSVNRPSVNRPSVAIANGQTQKRKPGTPMKSKPGVASNQNHDPTAVLAAVGAGMVPATMAMLVPFVAGRKKRSVNQAQQYNDTNSNSKGPMHLFNTYLHLHRS